MHATTETRISSLLRTKSRFLRSAHLERDFRDPDLFSGYVVTDFMSSCLERMAEGLRVHSGRRAWRLAGDYGSGKSSFALLFSHWFAGHDSSLPREIRTKLSLEKSPRIRPGLLPTLITCSREPLAISIIRALRQTLVDVGRLGNRSKLFHEIEGYLTKQEPNDDAVIDLILRANSSIISNSRGKGLLLVVDELGKFLEFASTNPQRQDVFLLQRLAEIACRSGREPLFIVCLLHQGFSDYAEHLNQSEQREWEKVAGRFEQIIFNQPLEEIAQLVASALSVRIDLIPQTQTRSLKEAMSQALELGWFGAAAPKRLVGLAPQLFPLHPTVLPVLVRLFRRFGQNERSLFSFLLSNEPFGLQSFAEKRLQEAEPYRLHDLYDYIRTSFGHKLAGQSYRSHWNLIDSVIESFATDDEQLIKVLKTVGILNLLNDTDLLATEHAVTSATAGRDRSDQKQIKAARNTAQAQKGSLRSRTSPWPLFVAARFR